jgi:pimeloyl-ACP methyl ester carboxylesterase
MEASRMVSSRLRLLAIACAGLGAALPRAAAQVPIPGDFGLAPPGPQVPAGIARFAGAWGGGAWDGAVPAALIVETIAADGAAQVVVAWGDGGSLLTPPGWQRLEARIAGGRLTLATEETIQDYEIDAGGALIGHRQLAEGWRPEEGWRSYVRLSRLEGGPAEIAPALALPVPRLWRETRISVVSQIPVVRGRRLALQTTIYRNPLPGRRPTIVLSHGTQDALSSVTRRYEEQARLFLALGYSVVVPMRKGYGGSEGPLLEASVMPEEVQLGSALEDLDAVVAALRDDPAVDPGRIVLVGADRGGFLSVAYASRHASAIAGVVNISGLWRSEHFNDGFNMEGFRQAGRGGRVPTLWVYARNDTFYPIRSLRADFAGFKAAGGTGRLIELDGPGFDGHALFSWIEAWRAVVVDELRRLAG